MPVTAGHAVAALPVCCLGIKPSFCLSGKLSLRVIVKGNTYTGPTGTRWDKRNSNHLSEKPFFTERVGGSGGISNPRGGKLPLGMTNETLDPLKEGLGLKNGALCPQNGALEMKQVLSTESMFCALK